MMLSASFGGPLLTDAGGTLAADFHPDSDRLFFIGFRFGAWADTSGFALLFDLDIGLRPRLWTGNDAGVGLVIGGGLGVAFLSATNSTGVALYHMPLRVGPYFDFGTFTFEVLGGPALYAAKGAFGAFEGIAELGARF